MCAYSAYSDHSGYSGRAILSEDPFTDWFHVRAYKRTVRVSYNSHLHRNRASDFPDYGSCSRFKGRRTRSRDPGCHLAVV